MRSRKCAGGRKKPLDALSLKELACVAQQTTQRAASQAVRSGRTVAGWKNGQLVEYGPGALPLVQKRRLS
jgi:hypothetical protein